MSGRFFDPAVLARTFRDPLTWLSLVTDLLPILAIILLQWGPTPLVALYWLENLVIGAYTILRLAGSATGNIAKLGAAIFLIPFFTLHYGMFCYGHGVFLKSFASNAGGGDGMMDIVRWAVGSGEGMPVFLAIIVFTNAVFFAVDYIGKREFVTANPAAEMFAPYGRIVTLHVAIILGAFFSIATDQPLLGVLILIVIRVVFGLVLSVLRRLKLDGQLGASLSAFEQAG
ncbi:DUF6498-containing protein [Hyphomonas johnsonii]|nr:DUF6498-containing protein [Hyphomonas johnsonii]